MMFLNHNNIRFSGVFLWAALLAIPCITSAQANLSMHTRLYTQPDPSASGGITGRLTSPAGTIDHVFAIPASRPEQVYHGEVTGDDRRSFRFDNLPMNRYDLLISMNGTFYEGFQLNRGEDSLTRLDRQQITEVIDAAEAFYNVKVIHRLEGETGRGNDARAIVTFGRDEAPLRRVYKLAMLRQVGPGWQIARTRTIYPADMRHQAQHYHRPVLSGIRVTDRVRDMDELNL